MKETMQQHLHTVGQKAIQNVIRHEYGDWPLLPTPPPGEKARGGPAPDPQQVTPS